MSARRIVNDSALILAERRARAGEVEWEEVQRVQDAMMPRCAAHGRPTSLTLGGRPLCIDCVLAMGDDYRLALKSHGLISGGLEREVGTP